MNAVTHEVQARLGIEVEDESVLISHLPDDPDGPGEIDRAIVWTITTVLDSPWSEIFSRPTDWPFGEVKFASSRHTLQLSCPVRAWTTRSPKRPIPS